MPKHRQALNFKKLIYEVSGHERLRSLARACDDVTIVSIILSAFYSFLFEQFNIICSLLVAASSSERQHLKKSTRNEMSNDGVAVAAAAVAPIANVNNTLTQDRYGSSSILRANRREQQNSTQNDVPIAPCIFLQHFSFFLFLYFCPSMMSLGLSSILCAAFHKHRRQTHDINELNTKYIIIMIFDPQLLLSFKLSHSH